jgi:hypothetical protein
MAMARCSICSPVSSARRLPPCTTLRAGVSWISANIRDERANAGDNAAMGAASPARCLGQPTVGFPSAGGDKGFYEVKKAAAAEPDHRMQGFVENARAGVAS